MIYLEMSFKIIKLLRFKLGNTLFYKLIYKTFKIKYNPFFVVNNIYLLSPALFTEEMQLNMEGITCIDYSVST